MKKSIISRISLSMILSVALVAGAGAQQKDKLDRSIRPKAGPAPKVQLGKIESFTLENGLKVFVVENHKLPRVSYSLRFNLSPVPEGDKAGASNLMAELLGTATSTRTKDQINEETDFIGAILSPSAEGVYAASLKKHQDKLLTLMSDVLLNPVFKEEELEKAKKQLLSGLAASKNTSENMAANIEKVLNFGKNHPYGEITTEQTVANITLEDCKKYYETYFRPNVAYLAIVGDITPAEARKLAEHYFGAWKRGEVPQHNVPAVKQPAKTQVAFVPRAGAVQSSIRISYPVALTPGHPDQIKARVMNDLLGGGSSARLFRNLRETYNLTYGAYSRLEADPYGGYFKAYAEVRTVGTDSAVNEFLKEIKLMRDGKVSQAELQGVINNLTGKFAISLENPATVAQFAINIDRYNLPKDYYETYLTKLAAVTVEDVAEMANKYLRPENANIIVVGDRDAIPGFVNAWKDKGALKFYDQYGNDFNEIKPAPAGVTAESVLKDYINAQGGEAKIRKITSRVVNMTAELQGMKLQLVSKRVEPKKKGLAKTAEIITVNGMLMQKSVFDGQKAAQGGMMGAKELSGAELEAAKENAEPFAELRYKELGYTLNLLGIEPVEGKDAYKIELTKPNGKKEFQYFDVADKLLVKTQKTEESPEGNVQIIQYLSDYREVKGVKVPYRIKTEAGPQVIDATVTSVEFNVKISNDDFVIK